MPKTFTVNRPGWDEYFMQFAINASARASCLKFLTGAIIVKENRIKSTGYNGAFQGFESCYEKGECRKDSRNISSHLRNTGACPAMHAERNALSNLEHHTDSEGATLYTLLFPCNECSIAIGAAQIKRVCYMLPYRDEFPEADSYFNQRVPKVNIEQFTNIRLLKKYDEVLIRRSNGETNLNKFFAPFLEGLEIRIGAEKDINPEELFKRIKESNIHSDDSIISLKWIK